jgi:dienelactone hydrolase
MWPWLGDAAATARRRDDLWRLLGPRPWRAQGVGGECLGREGPLERWRLHLNREQDVPALLLRPRDRAPRGVVLYCHAHGHRFGMGKDELMQGRPALQAPPYGDVLAARGWAALAIDHWGFGERQVPSECALVKRLLWQGDTLWGWRLHDTLAALDWLRAQPGFEALPVVTLGLSMGSTMALWAAALDERIAGCIELCCAAEYDALLDSGGFDGHGEYFFVPGLLTQFTLAEVAALIAPRPHLSCAGTLDPLTPPAGLASLDTRLREAYGALGAAAQWQQHVEPVGHAETPAMRAQVLAWLDRLAAN